MSKNIKEKNVKIDHKVDIKKKKKSGPIKQILNKKKKL